MRRRITDFLLKAFRVLVISITVILVVMVLNSLIEIKLLQPLWKMVDLSESIELSLLVFIICGWMIYNGWHYYECKYSIVHWSAYITVLLLFFYYKRTWQYIAFYGNISCWLVLLIAYPFGVLFHWICIGIGNAFCLMYNGIKNLLRIKDKNVNSESDEKLSPIVFIDDEPISGDNNKNDILGFNRYAKRIARSIIESKTEKSYSIGITAQWGAGKTSMLNLIINNLKAANNCLIVEFNPRKSVDPKHIQSDFLSLLYTNLKKYHSGANNVISKYMKELRVATNNSLWSRIIDISHLADVDTSRDCVENVIRSIDKRLVVIIDDFDRLTAEEIIEILKLIDKNASFKRTFFICAYDKVYVNKVLNKYFCSVTRDYTDKYFNLELPLPEKKQLHKTTYLLNKFKDVMKNLSEREIEESIAPVIDFMNEYLPTIRDINRFIGLVMASYLEVKNDVCFRDYLLVSLIKYKYPKEYEYLHRHLYFNLQYTIYKVDNYVLNNPESYKNVKSYPIIKTLFPNNTDGIDVNDKAFGYKHISWKRSFDYYFFDQEIGHVPYKILKVLINPNITKTKFKKIVKNRISLSEKMDITDFVISRSKMIHGADDFKNDYPQIS